MLKAKAKSIYFDNSAILVFATLTFIALGVGFTILGGVYGSIFLNIASKETALLVTLTFELLGIIFSFPLFFGYILLCYRIAHHKDITLSLIFEYYSDKKKLFAACSCFMKLLRSIVLKILLPLISYIFLYTELDKFCNSSTLYLPEYIMYSIKGLFILPFILLFLLCYFSFGTDIAKVFSLNFSKSNAIGLVFDKRKFFFLRLSLIPLYVISFLTFGLLFIVFTIPYTVILYSLFFKVLDSEEESITFDNIQENIVRNEKTTVFNINTDTEVQNDFE